MKSKSFNYNCLFLSIITLLTACGSSDSSTKSQSPSIIENTGNISNTENSTESSNSSIAQNTDNVSKIDTDNNFILINDDKFIASRTMVSTNLWHSKETQKVAGLSAYDKEQVLKVFEKVNEYRKAVGKKPLVWDEKLAAYAQMRSQELVTKYSHTRPNGEEPNSEIYFTAGAIGENIAAGQGNAEEVSLSWKNSPPHYKNIINDDFNKIGIGFVRVPNKSDPQGYTYYWTQIFGGGNAESPYSFDNNRQPKEPDIIKLLGKNIILLDENKLKLQGGKEVVSNASKAYKEKRLDHPIYSKSLQFSDSNFSAIIQDPATVGFNYQTFGEIVDTDQAPVQYVNIGKVTAPDNISIIKATYKGASLGSIRQEEHYYADVTATVSDKKMNISFTNTRFDYEGKGDVVVFNPDSVQGKDLNFTEKNLEWNSQNKRFEKQDTQGNHIFSHFYGPKGEEIGGQFSRDVEKLGRYNGAFGAKKQ